MIQYKQLLALLTNDDKTYPVELGEWAFARLSDDERQKCFSEMQEVHDYEEEQILKGNFARLPDLFETFNTEHGTFTIKVGLQYQTSDNFVKHEKLIYWQQRMAEDSSIVYYQEEIVNMQGQL